MADPYRPMLQQNWNAIVGMFRLFEAKNPIIEFDVNSLQVKAYPALEYLDGLSERSRESAKSCYRQAVADGALTVFVLDEKNRVLRSYVFPPDEDT